jgi:hypothetical protein
MDSRDIDPIPRNGRWIDDTPGPVLGLWRALSRRDWDEVKTFLSADCIYVDMPVGPALAARGPDDIVKRLKVGLEPLAGYENPRRPAGVQRLRRNVRALRNVHALGTCLAW